MHPSTEPPGHSPSRHGRPRRLLVLRHAKSAWPKGVADHDRPLGPRGLRDAPAVGRHLAGAHGLPDLALCSPARRARHTWELAAAELDRPVPTRHDPRLYGADGPELLDVLHRVSDEVETLIVVGHNPGLEDLVLLLAAGADEAAGAVGADEDLLDRVRTKFPTSAIAVLTWSGTWSGLRPGEAVLADLAIPRGVRDSS
ncbi:SixA phosphatase family protein [Streptomyces sp. NBC_00691]|uniref:SixA phosphatase family protein n=1 Tax=Streptomyces sp. NBC_00691 TaxID=2903671 RepID=UPI002E374E80|nr:histidine phosphatase family protein [Streptomyces sp. NBC_00691]